MIILSEVLEVTKVSKTAIKIEFKHTEIAKKAKVGQFVHIKVSPEFILRRPISICDVTGEIVTIVFEIRGEGTAKLAEVKSGDKLDILGPQGNGFNLDKAGEKPVFIGGGIGVPPLLFASKNTKNATAILGFRNENFVMLEDEFRKNCDEVFITTDDGSYSEKGFVTDVLKREIADKTAVFACGPTLMLKAIAEICKENSIYCEISLEERMACGVGACLVCACKVKAEKNGEKFVHVCKNGPVFDATEVF